MPTASTVTTVHPGDRVAIMPLFFCGRCVACTAGRPQSCERLGAVGLNWAWGGMAEFSIVHEHQVAPLPDSMTALEGAMVEPTAVAIHSVSTAGVKPGDVVLKVPAERVVTAEVPLVDAIAGGFESLLDPGSDQIKIVLDPAGASS
ncbi:MAG: alcohol dehydrogenase catalytic domain-containing protein [Solirubrobacteraceae bacterium]